MKAKNTDLMRKRTSPRGKTKPISNKTPENKTPLTGKHLYLDLKGYRGAAKLEEQLKLLGAKIEHSFSTDTNILITSSGRVTDYEKRKKCGTAASPGVSTPSPFNPGWTQDVDSPQESPGISEPNKPISRARAIVTKAKVTQNYGSTNIIEWARQWKIRIVHVEKVKTWVTKELQKLPPALKETNKQTKRLNVKHTQVRRLKGNYVKFEAANCHYRPVQKQLDSAQQVMFDTPVFTCPFEQKSITATADDDVRELRAECEGQNQHESKRESIGQSAKQQKEKSSASGEYGGGKLMTAGELRKFIRDKLIKEAKKGYCEICKVQYDNIDKHVKCDSHKKFVREKKNYSSLDAMIAAGPNLDQFLDDVIRYHKMHMQEGMRMMAKEDKMSKSNISDENIDLEDNKHSTLCAPETSNARKPSDAKLKVKLEKKPKPVNNDSDKKVLKHSEIVKTIENVKQETHHAHGEPDNIDNIRIKNSLNDESKNNLEKRGNVKMNVDSCDVPEKKDNCKAERNSLNGPESESNSVEVVTVSQEEADIFNFSKSNVPVPAICKDTIVKQENNATETASQRKPQEALDSNKLLSVAKENEAVYKTPERSKTIKKENNKSEIKDGKCATSQKRKRRLVKLKRNWSMLSDRSMQKLLMTSEEDDHFMGFHHPISNMSQNPPTDISFVNVDEVEVVDNSEVEWVMDENEDEPSSNKRSRKEKTVQSFAENKNKRMENEAEYGKKRKPPNVLGEDFTPSQNGGFENTSHGKVMTSTPIQSKKIKSVASDDLSHGKKLKMQSKQQEKGTPAREMINITIPNTDTSMSDLCYTPRAALLNAKEKILQGSMSPQSKTKTIPRVKRKLITPMKQKSSATPCILSLDQVMSMKSKDQSDSGSLSVKGSNKFVKSDRSSKGTSYRLNYIPGCKVDEKKKAKAKTVLSPKQNNIKDKDMRQLVICSNKLKRKLSPKKTHLGRDNVRRSPRKPCRNDNTQRKTANITYEFIGSSEMQ